MDFVEYADRELMAIDLANKLAGALRAALARSERVLFAVPGGSTPGPVFDALCAARIDWASVDVLLTDERWVRPDHPRSNTRLVRERLLVERAGEVVPRDDILDEVWGDDAFPSSRTIDNVVMRLRRLLEPDPSTPVHLHTVWGVGYRFTPEPEGPLT